MIEQDAQKPPESDPQRSDMQRVVDAQVNSIQRQLRKIREEKK